MRAGEQSVQAAWRAVTARLEKSFPSVKEMMDEAEADVLAHYRTGRLELNLHHPDGLDREFHTQRGELHI